MGSIIALTIVFSGLAGIGNLFGVNAASADYSPICATVTYSPWGNCINGIQTRDVIDKTPINCSLTAYEQAGRSQVCGKVLGVKLYAVGTLLRTPEGKIYVVMPGQAIKYIPDLNALKAYGGHPLYNVSDTLIAQYKQNFGQVLGEKIYADGTLLRGPDYKIYLIVNGKKQYIHDLEELYQYRHHRIINVSAAVISDYQNN